MLGCLVSTRNGERMDARETGQTRVKLFQLSGSFYSITRCYIRRRRAAAVRHGRRCRWLHHEGLGLSSKQAIGGAFRSVRHLAWRGLPCDHQQVSREMVSPYVVGEVFLRRRRSTDVSLHSLVFHQVGARSTTVWSDRGRCRQ